MDQLTAATPRQQKSWLFDLDRTPGSKCLGDLASCGQKNDYPLLRAGHGWNRLAGSTIQALTESAHPSQ